MILIYYTFPDYNFFFPRLLKIISQLKPKETAKKVVLGRVSRNLRPLICWCNLIQSKRNREKSTFHGNKEKNIYVQGQT